MEKELFDFVSERAQTLATAGSSKQTTAEAATKWLEAVKADSSDDAVDAATTELLDYLEGRPRTIDDIIAFSEGPAKELFGEDAAAQMLEKHTQRKADGEKFCDCPSCSSASQLLEKFGRI